MCHVHGGIEALLRNPNNTAPYAAPQHVENKLSSGGTCHTVCQPALLLPSQCEQAPRGEVHAIQGWVVAAVLLLQKGMSSTQTSPVPFCHRAVKSLLHCWGAKQLLVTGQHLQLPVSAYC